MATYRVEFMMPVKKGENPVYFYLEMKGDYMDVSTAYRGSSDSIRSYDHRPDGKPIRELNCNQLQKHIDKRKDCATLALWLGNGVQQDGFFSAYGPI